MAAWPLMSLQCVRGMAHSFGWIFETLGVRMMCLTAALDNIRVQTGIDAAGFVRMGERDAVRRCDRLCDHPHHRHARLRGRAAGCDALPLRGRA
eukprot:gene34884-46861_t